MKKVTVIPLDSRPCNTTWLLDLAKMAEIELEIYPRQLCGNLLEKADIDDMLNWLDQKIEATDYLIIAADGLCSGGLVQARLGNICLEDVINKLSILKKYKENNQNLKIFLFDTIMRTSITAYDNESEFYWGKMNEYSRLVGQIHFFNKENDKEKLKILEQEIPSKIISTYNHARIVKHELNKFFIELVSQEIIDYMILLQEDSMPYGVQNIEQNVLVKLIENNNLQNKVKIYNGTDEGGVVLLAKIINIEYKNNPKIYLHLTSPTALNRVMLFEDQLLSDNIDNMFETIGFTRVDDFNQADFILAIYTEALDYNLSISTTEEIVPCKDEKYYEYINKLNQFIDQGKKVAFVDLLFPNGGSLELLQDIHYNELMVYSAWNTASNALGSCLCEIACLVANTNNKSNKFKKERLLDDCIYQYIVRRIINKKYLELGLNIHNLGNNQKIIEEIQLEMEKYSPLIGDIKFTVSLPWNRTFEIDINVEE